MTQLNVKFERQMMAQYARGTLTSARELRTMQRELETTTDPSKTHILELGITLLAQEITLRKRRLAQWKSDPCGMPEDIFSQVSEV